MDYDMMAGITDCARVDRASNIVVNIERVSTVWYANNSGGDDNWYFVRCDEDDPAWIGLQFLGSDGGFEQPPYMSMPDDYESHPDVASFRGELE